MPAMIPRCPECGDDILRMVNRVGKEFVWRCTYDHHFEVPEYFVTTTEKEVRLKVGESDTLFRYNEPAKSFSEFVKRMEKDGRFS